jgi:hypothetical protein
MTDGRQLYASTITETNPERLEVLIDDTTRAMKVRLTELTESETDDSERREIPRLLKHSTFSRQSAHLESRRRQKITATDEEGPSELTDRRRPAKLVLFPRTTLGPIFTT